MHALRKWLAFGEHPRTVQSGCKIWKSGSFTPRGHCKNNQHHNDVITYFYYYESPLMQQNAKLLDSRVCRGNPNLILGSQLTLRERRGTLTWSAHFPVEVCWSRALILALGAWLFTCRVSPSKLLRDT